MKITIKNLKCPSWNDLQRRHWSFQMKMMNGIKGLVVAEARSQVPAKERTAAYWKGALPTEVHIIAHFQGSNRRDCDNLYVKPILDGLVFAKVIPDDNCDVVSSVKLTAIRNQEADSITIFLGTD